MRSTGQPFSRWLVCKENNTPPFRFAFSVSHFHPLMKQSPPAACPPTPRLLQLLGLVGSSRWEIEVKLDIWISHQEFQSVVMYLKSIIGRGFTACAPRSS
jgi:predicted alpha/beta-fold hydrolase